MADESAFPGLRSVLRNGLFLVGRSWTEAVLRAGYALLIARVLGPADYGLWSLVMTAYMLGVSAAALGTDMLISARLGRDRHGSSGFVEVSLALRLALLSVAAVGLGLIAMFAGQGPEVAAGLAISLVAIFGRGLSLWTRSVFQGMERGEIALVTTLACRLVEVSLGIFLLFATRNIFILLALHSASWLLEAAIAYRRAKQVQGFSAPRFQAREMLALARESAPVGTAIACNAALHAAPLLLAGFLGAAQAQVGQLGIVMQFAALAVMGMQAFLGATVPVLARALDRSDGRTAHYGGVVALIVLLLFGGLGLLAHAFGAPLLVGLLGADYAMAADVLPWAFVLGGLSLLPNGFWQQQVLKKRMRPGVSAGLAAVVLAVTLAITLWPQHGLHGVLLAVAAGWLMRALVLLIASVQKPT